MESWVEVACTHCQQSVRINRETVLRNPGKSFQCKSCGQPVQLPTLESEANQAPIAAVAVPSQPEVPKAAEPVEVPTADASPQVPQEVAASDRDGASDSGAGHPSAAATSQPSVPGGIQVDEPVSLAALHRERDESRRRTRKTMLFVGIPVVLIALFMVGFFSVAWFIFASLKPDSPNTAGVGSAGGNSANASGGQRVTSIASSDLSGGAAEKGSLVLDWPPSARHQTKVYIDKKEVQLRKFGENRFELAAGQHEITIKKYGETVGTHEFAISADASYAYELPESLVLRLQEIDLLAGRPDFRAGAGETSGASANENLFASWQQSLDEAKTLAAKSGKSLLIYFDGSDWCPYCKQLTAEVLVHPEFQSLAQDQFVLVHINFPRYQAARRLVEDAQRNAEVAQYYGVSAYPTLLLADEEGQPIVKVGYDQNGIYPFLGVMQQAIRMRDQRQARIAAVERSIKAGESPGEEDLEAALPAAYRSFYAPTASRWYELAAEQDPQNRSGLREEMFVLWWAATQERKDQDFPTKLEALRQGLTRFTGECEFTDPSLAAKLYVLLSVLTRRVDIAQSQDLAKEGIAFAGKDAEIKDTLTRLSEGVLSGGSGVLITVDGYILTNQHVVGFADEVAVTLGDKVDQEFTAEVLAVDVPNDLALIKLKETQGIELNPLALREPRLEKSDEIYVCGFPRLRKVHGDYERDRQPAGPSTAQTDDPARFDGQPRQQRRASGRRLRSGRRNPGAKNPDVRRHGQHGPGNSDRPCEDVSRRESR